MEGVRPSERKPRTHTHTHTHTRAHTHMHTHTHTQMKVRDCRLSGHAVDWDTWKSHNKDIVLWCLWVLTGRLCDVLEFCDFPRHVKNRPHTQCPLGLGGMPWTDSCNRISFFSVISQGGYHSHCSMRGKLSDKSIYSWSHSQLVSDTHANQQIPNCFLQFISHYHSIKNRLIAYCVCVC